MVLVENCESGHEHPGEGAPNSLLGELPVASLCSSTKKGSENSLATGPSASQKCWAPGCGSVSSSPKPGSIRSPRPKAVGHMKATWTACEGVTEFVMFQLLWRQGSAQSTSGAEL